jgi:aldehyde:ferredoxin oxidoreductase
MQSQNTTEIEGEEVQKSFLRGCITYIAEIEGEEVQKTFLRGCITYITEIEGEEAPKSFLRGCRACVFQCGRVGVWLHHHHHFASYHHIVSHNITSYIISHQ